MPAGTPTAPPSPATGAVVRNRLLRAIPAEEYARLLPHLEPIALEPMQYLADIGAPVTHAYFPENGIISLLSRLADGTLIENGTVGSEGMAGIPLVLGVDWTPAAITGQVPGVARRVDATTFRALLPELPGLRALLGRYMLYLTAQVSQSLACNSVHTVNERCARWLLMTHERVERDEFALTHEVLAQMLAVRRAGVTVAAGALQQAGFIRYSRGKVAIVDREGLERAACECYSIIQAHRIRLLGA
jgi:CRP-like cAMP-binding protein